MKNKILFNIILETFLKIIQYIPGELVEIVIIQKKKFKILFLLYLHNIGSI